MSHYDDSSTLTNYILMSIVITLIIIIIYFLFIDALDSFIKKKPRKNNDSLTCINLRLRAHHTVAHRARLLRHPVINLYVNLPSTPKIQILQVIIVPVCMECSNCTLCLFFRASSYRRWTRDSHVCRVELTSVLALLSTPGGNAAWLIQNALDLAVQT